MYQFIRDNAARGSMPYDVSRFSERPNTFDLSLLSPGVNLNPRALGGVASTGDNSAPIFVQSDSSINGGRYRSNDFMLDGVSIMLPENNNFPLSPTPDGTQEFKIMTNGYGPQCFSDTKAVA